MQKSQKNGFLKCLTIQSTPSRLLGWTVYAPLRLPLLTTLCAKDTMKYLLIIPIFFLLSSCVAVPQESSLIGQCLELVEPHKLWEGRESIYASSRLITSSDRVQIGPMEKTGVSFVAGTQFKVQGIFRNSNGSYGPFLRVVVEATSGDNKGVVADVPACVPYHPRPRWITNCTLNANELTFNNQVVRTCT
ncbi:hypothetical protein Misp06_00031 [Microbulbifer sp. NBRC 101763]